MPILTENIYHKLLAQNYKYACLKDFTKTGNGYTLTIKPVMQLQDTEGGYSLTSLADPLIKGLVDGNNGNIVLHYIL